mgnify:CR=1 FL=1
MFCPTSIIGLRFGKEGLYCLLYEQPKNKNTYPLCKKHTHYIMPLACITSATAINAMSTTMPPIIGSIKPPIGGEDN